MTRQEMKQKISRIPLIPARDARDRAVMEILHDLADLIPEAKPVKKTPAKGKKVGDGKSTFSELEPTVDDLTDD